MRFDYENNPWDYGTDYMDYLNLCESENVEPGDYFTTELLEMRDKRLKLIMDEIFASMINENSDSDIVFIENHARYD